jgi:hypothetical protein
MLALPGAKARCSPSALTTQHARLREVLSPLLLPTLVLHYHIKAIQRFLETCRDQGAWAGSGRHEEER